jgi:putative transposase
MPRKPRNAPGGEIYHVLNRSVAKLKMLKSDQDLLAFEEIIAQAMQRHPIRLLAYCLMHNHWHFVVWPEDDGQVSEFFRWLTHTHAMRWRVAHKTVGHGPLYQGRFKCFPVQRTDGLELVLRYVERNALSAGLVKRAQDWRWSSLWVREHGSPEQRALLSDWPIDRPADWLDWVNRPLTERELSRIGPSLRRDRPLGGDAWMKKIATRLDLGHTLRNEGRPRKKQAKPRRDRK